MSFHHLFASHSSRFLSKVKKEVVSHFSSKISLTLNSVPQLCAVATNGRSHVSMQFAQFCFISYDHIVGAIEFGPKELRILELDLCWDKTSVNFGLFIWV